MSYFNVKRRFNENDRAIRRWEPCNAEKLAMLQIGDWVSSKVSSSRGQVVDKNEEGVRICWRPGGLEWMRVSEINSERWS